jgi:hypothetical protein
MSALETQSQNKTIHTDLLFYAFKYQLKAAQKYKFSKRSSKEISADFTRIREEGRLLDYIPSAPVKSEILSYEEFALVWMQLEEVKRIRVPVIRFRASQDGYNLQNLYTKCAEYANSYHNSIILVKANNEKVFGCFLDTVPE